jgi:hypothetical protein
MQMRSFHRLFALVARNREHVASRTKCDSDEYFRLFKALPMGNYRNILMTAACHFPGYPGHCHRSVALL